MDETERDEGSDKDREPGRGRWSRPPGSKLPTPERIDTGTRLLPAKLGGEGVRRVSEAAAGIYSDWTRRNPTRDIGTRKELMAMALEAKGDDVAALKNLSADVLRKGLTDARERGPTASEMQVAGSTLKLMGEIEQERGEAQDGSDREAMLGAYIQAALHVVKALDLASRSKRPGAAERLAKRLLGHVKGWDRERRAFDRRRGGLGLSPSVWVGTHRNVLARLAPDERWHGEDMDYLRHELGIEARSLAEAREKMVAAGLVGHCIRMRSRD